MNRKTAGISFLILILLGSALIWINRDLYHYVYDVRCKREFTPETDPKWDYLVTGQIPLKPGSYVLAPEMVIEGPGSAVFLVDGNGEEFFFAELDADTENPVIPFEIRDTGKQVRLGIRYDPARSAVRMERVRITADHVLYKDSLLRHLTISGFLVILALFLFLRLCFPSVIRRLFPVLSRPENELAFVILLFLTLLSCCPLLDGNTYVHGEDMFFHLTRIRGLAESLRAGYFPVRDQLYWLHNYGYGVGFYYPDVFLYFPALLVLLGFNLLTAYKLFLGVCSFFAIFTVWYAAGRMAKNRTAAYAAALFMAFAAYRLSNLYYRGAVGETQAAVFYPLIILGLYEIFYCDTGRWPLFALGFFGILSCHIISLTIALVLTAVFLLTQVRRIFTDKKIFSALLKSVLLAAGASAFFWMPMLEQGMTNTGLRVNYVLRGVHGLNTANYAFPVRNLFARFKPWDNAFQADCIYPGWPMLLVLLLGVFAGKKRSGVKKADFMLGYALVLLWMCTKAFPWQWKAFLVFVSRIQFAYRLLLPATVLMCLAGGIYFSVLQQGRHAGVWLLLLFAFCFCSSALPVLRETIRNRSVPRDLFVMQDNRVSGGEYMPAGLANDFPDKNGDTVFIADRDPGLLITSHDRRGLSFSFSYELPEDSGEVRFSLPLIYYTGFQGVVTSSNGDVVSPEVTGDSMGLVSLSNSGFTQGSVTVSYQKTRIQRISEFVTLLTAGIWVFSRKRRKKQ